MEALFSLLKEYEQEMIEIRRHLHEHPELSYHEVYTPAYIAEYHQKLGHEVRTGVGGRGVVATLRGSKPGKTVALRADFDALAIQEENDIPYKFVIKVVVFYSLSTINLMYFSLFIKNYSPALITVKMKTSSWF